MEAADSTFVHKLAVPLSSAERDRKLQENGGLVLRFKASKQIREKFPLLFLKAPVAPSKADNLPLVPDQKLLNYKTYSTKVALPPRKAGKSRRAKSGSSIAPILYPSDTAVITVSDTQPSDEETRGRKLGLTFTLSQRLGLGLGLTQGRTQSGFFRALDSLGLHKAPFRGSTSFDKQRAPRPSLTDALLSGVSIRQPKQPTLWKATDSRHESAALALPQRPVVKLTHRTRRQPLARWRNSREATARLAELQKSIVLCGTCAKLSIESELPYAQGCIA